MKRAVLPIVALMAAICSAMAGEEWKNEPWRVASVELAMEETKINAAMWSQEISFWIAVADDGTNRSGFAEYTCLLLHQAGKPNDYFVSITVLDQASMLAGDFKELGKASCP